MKTKKFDCIEMKREIQEKHAREYRGLTEQEIGIRIEEKLMASDRPVGEWFRKIVDSKTIGRSH